MHISAGGAPGSGAGIALQPMGVHQRSSCCSYMTPHQEKVEISWRKLQPMERSPHRGKFYHRACGVWGLLEQYIPEGLCPMERGCFGFFWDTRVRCVSSDTATISSITDSDAVRILRITLSNRNIVRSLLYLSFTGYHFCSRPCIFLQNTVFSCVQSFYGVSQFQLISKGQ